MNKQTFLIAITILAALDISAQTQIPNNWFSIKAFLPGHRNAVIILRTGNQVIQKDSLHNDVYSYNGYTNTVNEGTLEIHSGKQIEYLPLFIEPGTIKIRDEGKKLVVFGTNINDQYLQLINNMESQALERKGLSFDAVRDYKRNLADLFIQENTDSPISLRLLFNYYYLDADAPDIKYYTLFNSLHEDLRKTSSGQKMAEEVRRRYAIANGRLAPLLVLPDKDENNMQLYSKGRYTIINFWASWCVPCRKEHPAIIALQKKYSSKVLSIVSVSLDANKSAWQKIIIKQGLSWMHLIDTQGWKGKAASTYSIKALPTNFLIDENGIIVGKNLTIENIDKRLSGLLH